MRSALDDAIFLVKGDIENKLDAVEIAKEKLDKLIRLKALKQKRLNGEDLTDSEVQEAMNILCWKNLAGCCAPEKECPWQMAVCESLGIHSSELYEIKKKAVEDYLGLAQRHLRCSEAARSKLIAKTPTKAA